jgi:hypothetical protein
VELLKAKTPTQSATARTKAHATTIIAMLLRLCLRAASSTMVELFLALTFDVLAEFKLLTFLVCAGVWRFVLSVDTSTLFCADVRLALAAFAEREFARGAVAEFFLTWLPIVWLSMLFKLLFDFFGEKPFF